MHAVRKIQNKSYCIDKSTISAPAAYLDFRLYMTGIYTMLYEIVGLQSAHTGRIVVAEVKSKTGCYLIVHL